LPPLRERSEDLPLLAEHFLASLGAAGRPGAELLRTPAFLSELARHRWPGNVRELRNYLERCLALQEPIPIEGEAHEGERRTDEGAPLTIASNRPLREARELWTEYCERRYLVELLQAHGNNVTAAAKAAGVDRPHFYRLLWRHGLR
jgi:DNA-binding NtrC family response regulator